MGLTYQGYGCPGKSTILDGIMMMELARVDSSIATFRGVHSGLAMGSIYLCASGGTETALAAAYGPPGKDRFF